MTDRTRGGRRGSKTIVALCAVVAAFAIAYATDTPGCLPERHLGLRLIGHDTQVRCHRDDRSLDVSTPGGLMRASRAKEGWFVSTPTRSYRIPSMHGVISMIDGDVPADAVPVRPDPDVGA